QLELAAAFVDEGDTFAVRRPAGAAGPLLIRFLQDLFGHPFDDVVDVNRLVSLVAADEEDAAAVGRKAGGRAGKQPLPAFAVGVHDPHAGLRLFGILVVDAEEELLAVGRPGGESPRPQVLEIGTVLFDDEDVTVGSRRVHRISMKDDEFAVARPRWRRMPALA